MSKNYFKGTIKKPYHLSMGAVLFNSGKEIACHHFHNASFNESGMQVDDLYILMRETLEMNESLEEALRRGLQEEFGAKAKLITYIGSIQSHFPAKIGRDILIEKTTLYFLMECITCDTSERKADDGEAHSKIEWHDVDYLIQKMRAQTRKFRRDDMDESEILERVRNMI